MENIDEPETTIEQEEGDNQQIKQAERFLNDQGRPSFDYMMNIAKRHTAQASEIIMEWAEKYDITFDPTLPLEETVQRIWTAMESSPDASV
ncbi:MAG: hypothetical protein KW804_00100 [Candidatus Doudnabacteria bacterium]|nr:hypothetical protein [Candidatus Doudnabacteria bacterium]